jgi:DNA polymerase-3 subunit chi
LTEVAFYHLQRSPLEKVLPKLLEKTLAQGKRALVLTGSAERAEALAVTLWTYDPGGWLPHGTAQDGEPAEQPVWLSERDENVNRADFLFLTEGTDTATLAGYQRCFDLFDGNDAAAVAAARGRWQVRKAAGHVLTYWQQNDAGSWERKA